MQYPSKLEVILTQACVDLHHAQNSADVDLVIHNLIVFEQSNCELPEWLKAWIDITKKNPHLTAEEHYKLPEIDLCSGLSKISEQRAAAYKVIEINQLKKLNIAINMADCDTETALRNCAYMIASRMLKNPFGSDCEHGGELGYEWHCKIDFDDSLSNPRNFKVLVNILRRETAFWHFDVKATSRKGFEFQPMRWI